jgi:hypothetical protein
MKYFNFIIITVLVFFVSSCITWYFPKVRPSPGIFRNEISESPEPEEESSESIFYEELITEIFNEDLNDILRAQITELVPDEEPLEETEEIAETEDDLSSDVEEIAADEPPVETAAAPVPPPVQTPPPTTTQPPAQTTPPPVQQPAQPPAQPPALLGSAEERNPVREPQIPSLPETPLRDAVSDSAVISQNVTPGQTTVIPRDDGIYFSRIVRATVGQIIEIPFSGTGWVYLGELASRRGIVYNSRRLDSEGQTFIFRAEEAGSYALKFFKQDFIRDYILNDHVQVIVGEALAGESAGWFNPPTDRGRVTAQPRWPTAIEEAEILKSGSILSSEPSQTSSVRDTPQNVTQPPAASQPPASTQPSEASQPPAAVQPPSERIPPDVLLQRARESFNTGNAAGAISLLDQYAQYYPETDELYWLYGQFYEANSPSRNILLSLDYYRRLVREYPQSTRYNDARSRIAYLERYYINIQ